LGAVQFRRGAMREVLTPDQRTKMRDQRRGAGWRRVVLWCASQDCSGLSTGSGSRAGGSSSASPSDSRHETGAPAAIAAAGAWELPQVLYRGSRHSDFASRRSNWSARIVRRASARAAFASAAAACTPGLRFSPAPRMSRRACAGRGSMGLRACSLHLLRCGQTPWASIRP